MKKNKLDAIGNLFVFISAIYLMVGIYFYKADIGINEEYRISEIFNTELENYFEGYIALSIITAIIAIIYKVIVFKVYNSKK